MQPAPKNLEELYDKIGLAIYGVNYNEFNYALVLEPVDAGVLHDKINEQMINLCKDYSMSKFLTDLKDSSESGKKYKLFCGEASTLHYYLTQAMKNLNLIVKSHYDFNAGVYLRQRKSGVYITQSKKDWETPLKIDLKEFEIKLAKAELLRMVLRRKNENNERP